MKYVYSGDCRICELGIKTGSFDACGEELFTGDIVALFHTDDKLDVGLTVIVADQFTTYSNGRHEFNEKFSTFPMGIKGAGFDSDEWYLSKVKDHSEVVDGEHWSAFGFSFKEDG